VQWIKTGLGYLKFGTPHGKRQLGKFIRSYDVNPSRTNVENRVSS